MSQAPEFTGIVEWIHTNPLRLQDLRGSVIGVEFWTRNCINCVHAAPHLQKLHERFGPHGFVLIGVHSPEFEEEKDINAIKGFLMQNRLTYPVAVDSDLAMWKAYHNRYWPTLYLIDKKGEIRAEHIGEGGYHQIAHEIDHLLKE